MHHKYLHLSILAVVACLCFSTVSFSAELPGEVKSLLKQWKLGGDNRIIIESLNDLVDRNDETVRSMFRREIENVATGGDAKKLVDEVLVSMSNYEMDLSTRLAIEVAKDYNVEAVLRTGSSGDRHMNWQKKVPDSGRFVVGESDDDISFFGPGGEDAAKEFNRLKASRKLGKVRCGGFGMSPITDATSYDLLVKQIQNPHAFAGAAGYGGIKKEIVEKGGAVIAVREGVSMVAAAERVSEYVARNKGSTLGEVMDVVAIARELEEFGPLTMYASCARQMSHNPTDIETVKYLLRIYAGSAAANSFEEAASLGCRHLPGYFKIVGQKLAAAYADKSGEAARALLREFDVAKLHGDVWEAVMLSTSHKLGEMVKSAEQEMGEGAVNIARHPELRRMIHEVAAGFALLDKLPRGGASGDVFLNVVPDILLGLKLKDPQRQTMYKVMYTAFVDARSLNEAAAEAAASNVICDWLAAGSPPGLTARLKEAGVEGVNHRRLLLEMAEERMAGKKACESVKNLQKLIANPQGDSFLWRMLSSETGQKFTTEAIAMAPLVLMTMYGEYQRGEMKNLSDAAFTLLDFPPGGREAKLIFCEGMNREVVFMFVKDGLYFTPAWPLALAGDVISMSWTVSDVMLLQNENEGIVDILVYNGEFDDKDGRYTFKELKLPDGTTVSRDGMRDWLFTTKYVKVHHSLEGLEYRINNLSEKSWHLFNGFYVANDPTLQQMRAAIDQQLSGINWDEAGRYFKEEGNIGEAGAGYILWLAGVEYVKTSGRNVGWAKLYERLKSQLEDRKDILQKKFMVPQLIGLAEEKRATLNAENEYKPKLAELQKQIEAIRGGDSPADQKLGFELVDEVDKRAKLLASKDDSIIFKSTKTQSDKKFTRGEYWQAAYAAYLRIYSISKDIPGNVKRMTGFDRSQILRFKWTGDYIDDLRKAEQSSRGFAYAIFKSRNDIQRIKGSMPVPEDKTDAQAFDILGSVLFQCRMALDDSDKDMPASDASFFMEYAGAIEKVKALYARNNDFNSLLQKGSRLIVVPHPILMGTAADVELQVTDSSLLKLQSEKNLAVTWSAKPTGRITGAKNGFTSRLAADMPEPLILTVEVEKLGPDPVKGSVMKLVQVVVPDDFITMTMNPQNPIIGGSFAVAADIPHGFYGKAEDRFEYRWSGKRCVVAGGRNRTVKGKAGFDEGPGSVTVELWVANESGESSCVGRKSLDFNVVKDASAQLSIDGGARFQEGDPILFQARLRGVDEKEISGLGFEWIENGKKTGEGKNWNAGKRIPGHYSVQVRAAWKDNKKQAILLAQRHDFTVEERTELTLELFGPAAVTVDGAAVLNARLGARTPEGKQLADSLKLEWSVGGTVFWSGPTLSMDTSTPGSYVIAVNAVASTPSGKKICASGTHAIQVKPKPEADKLGDTEPAFTGKRGSQSGTTPPSLTTGMDTSLPGSAANDGTANGKGCWVLVASKEWSEKGASKNPNDAYTVSVARNAYGDESKTVDGPKGGFISSSAKATWTEPPASVAPGGKISFALTTQYTASMTPGTDYSRTRFLCAFTRPFIGARLEVTTRTLGSNGRIIGTSKQDVGEQVSSGTDFKYRMPPDAKGKPPPADSDSGSKSGIVTWTFPEAGTFYNTQEFDIKVFAYGLAGSGGRIYTYAYNGQAVATNALPTNATTAVSNAPPLEVALAANTLSLTAGETSTIHARVMGGTPPYVLTWTGTDETGRNDSSAIVMGKNPGKQTVSVSVSDLNGRTATKSLVIQVSAIKVTVRQIDPPSSTICLGKTGLFKAEISGSGMDGKMPARYKFQWQPHPEVAFDPFESEGRSETTATFNRPGKVGIWVEVLAGKQGAWAKVAESEQLQVDVVKPEFTLEVSPASPCVGEEFTARLMCKPNIDLKDLDIRWIPPSSNARQLASQKPDEMKIIAIDERPVKIEAVILAKTSRDDLGKAETTVTARKYDVKVSSPKRLGPAPRVWKEGIGLADVPEAIATFQDVFVNAEITPKPSKELRWKWTVSPDGCTLSSPASRETRANASLKGTYELAVEVSNSDGVMLGKGTGSFSVSVSAEDAKDGAKGKQSGETLARAKQAVAGGKLEEAIGLARDAAGMDPRNTEAVQLSARWEKERSEVADYLKRFEEAVSASKLPAAEEQLKSAQRLHPLYRPVVDAASKLDGIRKKQKETEAEAQQLVSEGYALEGQKQYRQAVGKYKKAYDIVRENALADRIRKVEAMAEKEEKAQQLVNDGQVLEQKGDLKGAVSRYYGAYDLVPDKKLMAHIEDLEGKIKELRAKSEVQKQAQDLINEGYTFEGQKQYRQAVAKYKKAYALIPDKALKDRISKIEALADREEKAQQLVNDGSRLEKNGSLEGAIGKYEAALALVPDDGLRKHIAKLTTDLIWQKPSVATPTPPETVKKQPDESRSPVTRTDRPQVPTAEPIVHEKQPVQPVVTETPAPPVSRTRVEPPAPKPAKPTLGQRNVAGTYVSTHSADGMSMSLTLKLQQSGSKLSGTMYMAPAPPESAAGPVVGTINGNSITLVATASAESAATPMNLTVSPDGRTLTLTVTVDGETNTMIFNKQ